MSTLDVLTVRLEADIAVFQQQLDRARAQLAAFGSSTVPAEQGIARVGTAATKSVAGLSRVNGAFIAITRQATGMSPVLARVADVFGTFAIGTGPMVPILAGLTAVAVAYSVITREAREAAKAAEDAGKKITDAWLAHQTQGDIDLINQQADVGGQLDAVNAKLRGLQRVPDISFGAAKRLKKLQDEQLELQTQFNHSMELLDVRRTDRQKEENERRARENKRAQTEALSAAEKHFRSLAAVVAAGLGTTDQYLELRRAADQAFKTMTDATAPVNQLAAAFERWEAATAALRNDLEKLPPVMRKLAAGGLTDDGFRGGLMGGIITDPGSRGRSPGTGGFVGRLGSDIKGMLNPEMLATSLATGMVNSAIGMVLPALHNLGKSLLGFASAAEQATQQVIQSLDDMLVSLRGTDTEKAFSQLRNMVLGQVDSAVTGSFAGQSNTGRARRDVARQLQPLRDADTYDEFRAELLALEPLFNSLVNGAEIWNKLIQVSEATWEDLNDEVKSVTDSIRNMAPGFKINLATFNATQVESTRQGQGGFANHWTRDPRLTLQIVPEGILTVVETAAVRRIRSGGTLAWEVG